MNRFSFRQYRLFSWLTLALSGGLAGCGGGGGGDSDLGRGNSGSAGVQGVIAIEAGSRVDGDYADLFRVNGGWPTGSRDAVSVPIPVTAAGYLSAGAGTYGNGDEYPADASDTYTATLISGDRYYLQCFPSEGGTVSDIDATLELNGASSSPGEACGSSDTVSTDSTARLTLSTSGGGPFRYVLTIAPQGALLSFDASWPEPDLRLNEAVLSGPAAVASTLSSSGVQAGALMENMRAIGPDLWHVTRGGNTSAQSGSSSASSLDPRAATIEWIKTLREDFGLKAEPNYLVRQSAPALDDPFYIGTHPEGPDNWNLAQINLPSAWYRSGDPSGRGVGVAVLDTGVLSTNPGSYGNWHADLANNVVAEGGILDFVSSTYDVDGADGRDANPATPLTPGSEASTSFHGTHVAGIVAAADNLTGTIGVAYEATILPYRVLGVDPVTGDDGTGSLSDLVAAITAASDRPEVDVINLSLGGLPQLSALQAATDYAHDKDILVVAAGGNSGDASAVFPAANRRVLGVGATKRSGELASYSNYGVSVDLMAPGGDLGDGIVNAYGGDSNPLTSGYAYLAGTSMAAPHVTGLFALMKDVATVTPDQFRAQLIAGYLTSTVNSAAVDDYVLFGQGLLDADKALDPLTRGSYPTVVSAWPRVLEVSATGSESEVLLEVLKDEGASAPVIDAGFTVPNYFNVTDGNGDPVTPGNVLDGSLRVSVDPSVVPSGRPLAENIVIPYSNESGSPRELVIPVYVQTGDPVDERNAGRHYVLLLDADDFNSANSQAVVASYQSGQYRYAFSNVAAGNYILVAGTDLDNNGYICENGEACAEYPRAGARVPVTVGQDQALRLDMTTSFRRPSIAEMGLPRYGFEGYPIPGHGGSQSSVDKQLK